LIRGCEKVEKVAGERKADPKEALLDWFGVGAKAQEISSFVKRMALLAQRVSPSMYLRRFKRQSSIRGSQITTTSRDPAQKLQSVFGRL
jgi:hypothetical protein